MSYRLEHIHSPTSLVLKRAATLQNLLHDAGASCELQLSSGKILRCGSCQPSFKITLNADDMLFRNFDELSIADSYIKGDFDIEGDMCAAMDLRSAFAQKPHYYMFGKLWLWHMFQPLRSSNKAVINHHYNRGNAFYLTFIDRRYRFYSHGIFASDSDTLEDASEQKLETMYNSLRLQPGMKLLDIGGGWGGVAEYCGRRGVHVTELTIAEDSYRFIKDLIVQADLPAEVYLEDFLFHQPREPYDAAVIYGVIEHIPNYRFFCRHIWDCLKPGGLIYLDAAASKRKYDVAMFVRRYLWTGRHTYLCLQELIKELIFHGIELLEVKNESHDYEITMRHWAERFDRARNDIVSGWGEEVYRTFRLYLWGGSRAFHNDLLQAYHIVARRQ